MAVRNFYLSANIDGRQTKLAGGPRSRDGGLDATIYVRDRGDIVPAVTIECFAYDDGRLRVNVFDDAGDRIMSGTWER